MPAPARAQELEWRRRIPGPSGGGSMAYDAARASTVMLGGPSGADTWEWDGALWTKWAGDGPRAAHNAMVYDAARRVIVLFDGVDTWERHGSTWTRIDVPCPPRRSVHAMAYDSARGVTVLLGGTDDGDGGRLARSDTWEWDGIAWMLRATNGPARMNHAMAYDPGRRVTVAFGGATDWPSAMGTTWEWDGTTWTERIGPEPLPRWNHAMTYDPVRGVIVLNGGTHIGTFPGYENDTWELDESAWTERLVSGPSGGSPPPLLAYDTAREVAVLQKTDETWELSEAGWTPRMVTEPTGLRWHDSLCYGAARRSTVVISYLEYGQFQMVEWDGARWLRISGAAPVGRVRSMAYDSARDLIVAIVSRDGGGAPDDTWEWNGTWTLRAAGTARLNGGIVYDSARGVCVRLSSHQPRYGAPYEAQTLEWDGTAWTPRDVPMPLRSGHVSAYDSARQVTVVYGGVNPQTGQAEEDTWEWDGTAWTRRTVGGPPPNHDPAMVYDTARGVTMLMVHPTTSGDTQFWEWDGWTWMRRAYTGLPQGLGALAYDTARRTAVLFRGDTGVWELTCVADINHDGAVDFPDYLAFLHFFDAGDPRADLNGDGFVDFTDYLDFLGRFDAGC